MILSNEHLVHDYVTERLAEPRRDDRRADRADAGLRRPSRETRPLAPVRPHLVPTRKETLA